MPRRRPVLRNAGVVACLVALTVPAGCSSDSAVEVDGVAVQYDDAVHTFDDQVEIVGRTGAFSAGGDSGSVIWRSRDRAPLGLLFAGSARGGSGGAGVTFANPLATVLGLLDAEWVG